MWPLAEVVHGNQDILISHPVILMQILSKGTVMLHWCISTQPLVQNPRISTRCHILEAASLRASCSSHVASSTSVWFCPGVSWHPEIFLGALPVLHSACSKVGLFVLSWNFHQLLQSDVPSLYLSPSERFTETSNLSKWEINRTSLSSNCSLVGVVLPQPPM